jgi:hypothetical protein
MSRLECDAAVESLAERGEERAREARVERQARRQLHEQAAEAGAEWREVGKEGVEQLRALREPVLVGDRLRELHREPE